MYFISTLMYTLSIVMLFPAFINCDNHTTNNNNNNNNNNNRNSRPSTTYTSNNNENFLIALYSAGVESEKDNKYYVGLHQRRSANGNTMAFATSRSASAVNYNSFNTPVDNHKVIERNKRDTNNVGEKRLQSVDNDVVDGGANSDIGDGDEDGGAEEREHFAKYEKKNENSNPDLALHTKYKEQKFYKTTARKTAAAAAAATHTTTPDLSSSNLVTTDIEERDDICKYCDCLPKNAFKSVLCDFTTNSQLNPSFGRHFQVPDKTIALTIQLARNTVLRLRNGFFQQDKVNSLKIIGSNDGGSSEQVEIETNAFEGNSAPQLEMYFENIYTIFIRTRAFSGDGKLTIRNCTMVKLEQNAFENALIHGLFTNIRDLRIEERAFNHAQTKLRIESSKVDDLYRFEASLNEIQFINCTLGTINGGTFDVTNINSIVFDGCTIDTIKTKAITEKLYSQYVAITHAKIGIIEKEAIFRSGIRELIITENTIDTIQEKGIHVNAGNVTISGNQIRRLEQDWLQVDAWSYVTITHNRFGDFGRLTVGNTTHPNNCLFDTNSISKPQPSSLNITHAKCIMHEIVLDKPCRCNTDWLEKLTGHDLRSETYCTIDQKLSRCFNTSIFNYLKYINEVCDETKTTLDCRANINLKKVNGEFYTPEELENSMSIPKITTIALIILAVVAIVIIAIVLSIYCQRLRQHKNRYNDRHLKHVHVFTEKDRNAIDKAAEIVQTQYPNFHKQFDNCRLQLYRSETDSGCEKIISDFTDLLHNIGKDDRFKEFNDILVKHLQPPTPTAPSEIYSELTTTGSNLNACYASNSIYPVSVNDYESENACNNLSANHLSANNDNENEPIYAEPNSPYSPLLNIYCQPADRNIIDSEAAYAYSEPINSHEQAAKLNIPPPVYAKPHRHHNNNIAIAKQEFLSQ